MQRTLDMKCKACGLPELRYAICDDWLCPPLLLKRVMARSVRDEETGCWVFQGAKCGSGYGHLGIGRGSERKDLMPHRVAYEATRGTIPADMQLDHLCQNKACCNPAHLELVTSAENTRRHFSQQEKCKLGQALEFIPSKGRRGCAICRNTAAATSKRRACSQCGKYPCECDDC